MFRLCILYVNMYVQMLLLVFGIYNTIYDIAYTIIIFIRFPFFPRKFLSDCIRTRPQRRPWNSVLHLPTAITFTHNSELPRFHGLCVPRPSTLEIKHWHRTYVGTFNVSYIRVTTVKRSSEMWGVLGCLRLYIPLTRWASSYLLHHYNNDNRFLSFTKHAWGQYVVCFLRPCCIMYWSCCRFPSAPEPPHANAC